MKIGAVPHVHDVPSCACLILGPRDWERLTLEPEQLGADQEHVLVEAPLVEKCDRLGLKPQQREVSWLWALLHILRPIDGAQRA